MISDPQYKVAFRMSIIIVLLMTMASISGLLMEGLYQDNHLVTSGWIGNDLVTLFLAVPLLALTLVLVKGGSQRAQLVWPGLLFYCLYNYAFYLFGAAYNSLFLIYVLLFTLSAFALVFGLSCLDIKSIASCFKPSTPVRVISGFMALVALLLGVFHVSLAVNYVVTGQVPEFIVLFEKSSNLISALDLSFTVSLGFLGALWLWQRRPWGYVVAVIWNVKSVVYLTALSAATVSGVYTGASESMTELALWLPIAVGCLISLVFLLKSMSVSKIGTS